MLGLPGSGHDSAAALLRISDGRSQLLAMVEEERWTRRKHEGTRTPIHSVRDVLRISNIPVEAIDCVAVGWDFTRYANYRSEYFRYRRLFAGCDPMRVREGFECRHLHQGEYNAYLSEAYPKKLAVADFAPGMPHGGYEAEEIRRVERLDPARYLEELGAMFAILGRDLPPVVFVRHHLAHAASAYYASGFTDRTLVLVVDGAGEGGDATSVWLGEGTSLSLQEVLRAERSSIGRLYSFLTSYLGFEPWSQEGQVMGLAPWGDPERYPIPGTEVVREDERKRVALIREAFSRFCQIGAGGVPQIDPDVLFYGIHDLGYRLASDELVALLSPVVPPRGAYEPILAAHANMAYVLQSILEECLTALIRRHIERTGCRRVAIAGGVGLNAKCNGKLLEQWVVDGLFVQPLAGDSGTALGTALEVAKQRYGADPRFVQRVVTLGPEYEEAEIARALAAAEVPHRRLGAHDAVTLASRLIVTGHPVAWFQGRREVGPRALCSTSILADATDPVGNTVANLAKGRRWWRPSAISLTPREFSRLLAPGAAADAPFMITTFPVRPEHAETIRAGLHPADRTTRPQVVHAEQQPIAFQLLQQIGETTGVEAVLNTSLNRQEPIVHSPEQALATLSRLDGVDYLIIGEHVVWKRGADPSWLLNRQLPEPQGWTCAEIKMGAGCDADVRLVELANCAGKAAAVRKMIAEFLGELGDSDPAPVRQPIVSRSGPSVCAEWFFPAMVMRICAERGEMRLRLAVDQTVWERRRSLRAPPYSSWLSAGIFDDTAFQPRAVPAERVVEISPSAISEGLRLLSQRLHDLPGSREITCHPVARIAFLGRVAASKGVEEFLFSIRHLRDRFGGRIQATLHGNLDAKDISAWRSQIMRWIAEFGLEDHAVVAGSYQIDQIPSLIADADLVILPSRREGFTQVSLEAMACGKPVVLTAAGGNIDLFRRAAQEHLPIGALVENGLPHGAYAPEEVGKRIAESSFAILSTPGLAVRLGKNAKVLATKVYSETSIGGAWHTAIADLVGLRGADSTEIRLFLVAPGSAPWRLRGGGERYLIRLFRRLHQWEDDGPHRFRVSLLAFRERADQHLASEFLMPPQFAAQNLHQVSLFESGPVAACGPVRDTDGEEVAANLSRLFDAIREVRVQEGRPVNSPEELRLLASAYIDALAGLYQCFRGIPYHPVMRSRPVRALWEGRFRGIDATLLDRAFYGWETCNHDAIAFNLACLTADLDRLGPLDAGILLFWGRPYTFLTQVLLSRFHNVPYLVHEGVFEIEAIFDYLDRDDTLPDQIKHFYRQHLVLVYASVLGNASIIAPQASFNHGRYRDWFGIETDALVIPNCIDTSGDGAVKIKRQESSDSKFEIRDFKISNLESRI
ncbi:MAG: carbamoyltransferase C-terminal domain-containing protein [Acidobacteriota bacterium]